MHPGRWTLGLLPALAELAVRQAPRKKYQLLVVVVPVKSSEKVACASLLRALSSANTMIDPAIRYLVFIVILGMEVTWTGMLEPASVIGTRVARVGALHHRDCIAVPAVAGGIAQIHFTGHIGIGR